MTKFKVIINIDEIYEVEAESKDDAADIVLSGDIKPIDSDLQGYDVYED